MKRHDDNGPESSVKRPASAFTEQIRWMCRQVVRRFRPKPPPDDTSQPTAQAR